MNDERPIEKLLRRYATKRRDEAGTPPELHPATRRLLQGEVARQHPKPASEDRPAGVSFFALLTQRWAYALGIFLVLGVAAMLILPSLNQPAGNAMLAKKSEADDRAVRESIAPAAASTLASTPMPAEAQSAPTLAGVAEERRNEPAPSGGGNLARSREESAAMRDSLTRDAVAESSYRVADAKTDAPPLSRAQEAKQTSFTSQNAAAPASRSLSAPAPARAPISVVPSDSLTVARNARTSRADASAATAEFAEKRQAEPASASVAAVAPVVVTPGSQDKSLVARGGGVEKDADRFYSQSFANVAPEQFKAKVAKAEAEAPAVPVLANFQVQQVGNQLRVVDGDGSTYLGELNAAAASLGGGDGGKENTGGNYARTGSRPAPGQAGVVSVNQPVAQNYLWRVEGTNRTLNQNVVFSWNFVETNRTVATSQLNPAGGTLTQDAAKLPSQFQQLLNNSVINGRAQLGPAQQIEVNAVPVKP